MSWQDDEEIQQKLRERAIRNGILRTALLWTPFFLLAVGALLFFTFDKITGGDRSTWFLLVVLVILSILFGSQAIQSILDLASQPHVMRGKVTRRWARNDMLVMKTHYVRVGSQILRADVDLLVGVKVGDEVEVRYHRHSAIVLDLEPIPAAAEPGTAASQAEA